MVDLDGGEVEITATNLAGNEISSWKGWLEQDPVLVALELECLVGDCGSFV